MAQKPTRIDDIKRPSKVAPSATSRPIVVSNRSVLPNDPMVVPVSDKDDTGDKPTAPVLHTARVIKPLDDTLTAVSPLDDASTPKEETESKAESKEESTPAKPFQITPPKSALNQKATDVAEEETGPKPESEVEEEAEPEDKPLNEPAAAVIDTEPVADTDAKSEESAAPNEPEATPQTPPASVATQAPVTPVASTSRDPEAEVSAEEIAAAEAAAARENELEQLVVSGKYKVPINAVQRRRSRMHALLLTVVALVLIVVLADVVIDMGLVHVPSMIPHTHFFSTTPSLH